jgi:hypothetical protein
MTDDPRAEQGKTPHPSSSPSGVARALSAAVAIGSLVLLLDAAVETFLAGSPLRWWVSPSAIVFVGLSIWLWKPGETAARRWGWPGVAAWSLCGLLLLLATTAWLPAGQTDGVRLLWQPTAAILTAAVAAAVLLAGFVIGRAIGSPTGTTRLAAFAAVLALTAYALISFGVGLYARAPFASLFQGGAAWQSLPRWLQGAFLGVFALIPMALIGQAVRIAGCLRARQPVRVLVHQATALVMSLLMATSGLMRTPAPASLAGSAGAGSASVAASRDGGPMPLVPSLTGQQAVQRLDETLQAVKASGDNIAGDTFDPRAIVTHVGKEPARLFEWVRDNTYWAPYRGALRGPVGVLMDRLGSSLDRSLLLAELLSVAGHKVQLVRGAIDENAAAGASAAIRAVPEQPVFGSSRPAGSEADELLSRLVAQSGVDAAQLRDAVSKALADSQRMADLVNRRVAAQAPVLASAVRAAGATDDAAASAASALREHWWVQYFAGGAWVDLDPLTTNAEPAKTVTASARTYPYAAGQGTRPLDGRDCHEVTIRIVVERWRAGGISERTALTHTFRPADAIGQSIVLQHAPLAGPSGFAFITGRDPLADYKAQLLKQTEWLPYLSVGVQPVKRASVRADGTVNTAPSMNPAAQLSPGGGFMGGLGGAMGGAEAPEAPGVLTAEWLEYDLRVPGEPVRTIRRQVFDLLGEHARATRPVPSPRTDDAARMERGLALAGSTEILPVVCRLSPSFIARQWVDGAHANRPALAEMAARIDAADAEGLLQAARKVKQTPDRLYDLAIARFDWSTVGKDVYLDQPNLLSYHLTGATLANNRVGLRHGYDIVANDVAVRPGVAQGAFAVRLAQGAADTNAEGALLGATPIQTAGTLIGDADLAGSAPLAIRAGQDQALSQLKWPADALRRVQKDLAAGQIVVVPRTLADTGDADACAFWSINPKTGTTLGIGPAGWGAATEKVTLEAMLKFVTTFVVAYAIVFILCIASSINEAGGPNSYQEKISLLKSCNCAGIAGGAGVTGAIVELKALVIAAAIIGAKKEAFCR